MPETPQWTSASLLERMVIPSPPPSLMSARALSTSWMSSLTWWKNSPSQLTPFSDTSSSWGFQHKNVLGITTLHGFLHYRSNKRYTDSSSVKAIAAGVLQIQSERGISRVWSLCTAKLCLSFVCQLMCLINHMHWSHLKEECRVCRTAISSCSEKHTLTRCCNLQPSNMAKWDWSIRYRFVKVSLSSGSYLSSKEDAIHIFLGCFLPT